jgi:hypothetical protein
MEIYHKIKFQGVQQLIFLLGFNFFLTFCRVLHQDYAVGCVN